MYLGSKQKRLEQRTKNDNLREHMLISLGSLGKLFLTWKAYIYKQKRSKTNLYQKS